MGEPEEQLEERVDARMARQEVLIRDHAPELVVVIDERVVRCPVGGSKVMYGQLQHLAETAERMLVQVVPLTASTYHGLNGPFEIATIDSAEVVYTDSALRGYVVGTPDAVDDAKRRWDTIRAEALSRRQSMELLIKAARSYEDQQV